MKLLSSWRVLLRDLAVIIVVLLAASIGFTFYMAQMPGTSHEGPLPPFTTEESATAKRLERDVVHLAGTLKARSIYQGTLHKAQAYLEETLKEMGYPVDVQPYRVSGIEVANVAVELVGTKHPEEIVIIGAHYDTIDNTPGADDNASGTAGVLELARRFADRPSERTLRFVFFANEEPPYFQTERMGSVRYADRCHVQKEQITAMISLEMLGFFSDEPGSQQYPPPFSFFYPDTGNFIGFVGDLSSRALVHQALLTFREHTPLPSEGVTAPGFIPGIGWSDHWAFWQHGYPAIMVTDTAFFRNKNYHQPGDQPETLDYNRMARVLLGLTTVVADLVGAPDKKVLLQPIVVPEKLGTLDQEQIQAVIRQSLKPLQACYERELRPSPNLASKVVLDFTIELSGEVETATISTSTHGYRTLDACILEIAKRWHFPQPEGGVVQVSYPFIFRAGG